MADRVARLAQPLLLLDAALLLAGVLLTSLNLLLLGWTIYAFGHIGAILAFITIALVYRPRMDGWAWAGLAVLLAGLILALPAIASIWSTYLDQPTGREMIVPLDATPFGSLAELVTWIGLAWYGLAARGSRALPRGAGWIFVVAAAIGLVADFRLISPLAWALAMLVVVLGLVVVATSPLESESAEPSNQVLSRT